MVESFSWCGVHQNAYLTSTGCYKCSNTEQKKSWAIPPCSGHAFEGIKKDEGKPRMDLIPPEALEALGRVLAFGETKGYENRNWEKGMEWGRVYAAAIRHLNTWWSGQSKDTESGLSHLEHALANIAFLLTYEKRNVGKDTRKDSKK